MGVKNLTPQYYSFRWLTLLLTQEFELPDVLRLWDSLFSDHSRFEFLIYICCSMLIFQRDKIMEGDFYENVAFLQDYPPVELHDIFKLANDLRDNNLVVSEKKFDLNLFITNVVDILS